VFEQINEEVKHNKRERVINLEYETTQSDQSDSVVSHLNSHPTPSISHLQSGDSIMVGKTSFR
jgi:hypothetical protein